MESQSGQAKAVRLPQLAEALEELDKAVETVNQATMAIYELLQLRIPDAPDKAPKAAIAPVKDLIGGRIDTIGRIKDNLYCINSRLGEIHNAVTEL